MVCKFNGITAEDTFRSVLSYMGGIFFSFCELVEAFLKRPKDVLQACDWLFIALKSHIS